MSSVVTHELDLSMVTHVLDACGQVSGHCNMLPATVCLKVLVD